MAIITRETMARSKEWKDRRKQVVQERIDYVCSRIIEIGGIILEENGLSVTFRKGGLIITYWPFTGGYTGKGIVSGKGLNNLCRYLVTGKVPINVS